MSSDHEIILNIYFIGLCKNSVSCRDNVEWTPKIILRFKKMTVVKSVFWSLPFEVFSTRSMPQKYKDRNQFLECKFRGHLRFESYASSKSIKYTHHVLCPALAKVGLVLYEINLKISTYTWRLLHTSVLNSPRFIRNTLNADWQVIGA